ncbi:MAG: glycosyltransferase family 25 protein [Planctomycetota bacterium]
MIRGASGWELPIYVAHVKQGFEDRRVSIERQLGERRLEFEFMLDGDVADLSRERMDRWFSGQLAEASPKTSCACKHLLIWEAVVERGERAALVLEDDALLSKDFVEVVEAAVAEMEREHRIDDPWFVSLENSTLRFVPSKERRPGQYLYPASKGRCTGAYLMGDALARKMLEAAEGGGVDVPVDWYVDRWLERADVQPFWCEPTVVEQGSHAGVFATALGRPRTSWLHRVHWSVRKMFRRMK